MNNWSLELRVVYEDLPDMVELETRVLHGEWSARSRAYASPSFLKDGAERLVAWTNNPKGTFRLDAGADTGIGWLVLDFFIIDSAGHARCAVTLATGDASKSARTSETWRFSIEMKTELGLIERFGRECHRWVVIIPVWHGCPACPHDLLLHPQVGKSWRSRVIQWPYNRTTQRVFR